MAEQDGIGKYDIISKGALDTWEDFINLSKAAHAQLLEIVKSGPKLNEALNKAEAAKALSDSIQDVVNNMELLLKTEKKIELLNNKLNGGDERAAEAKRKQAEATKRQADAARKRAATIKTNSDLLKLSIQLENKNKNSIEALIIKNKMLTIEMNKLGNITKRNQAEYRKLSREYDSNKKAIDKINNSQRKHSTSLSGVINQVKNLAMSYIGVRAVYNQLVKVFEDTKTIDSLNFALRNVIVSSTELAETEEYLSKITQSYGTNLIDTTRSYIKFRAAIAATNLSVASGREIFDAFARTASVLGLRADEVNGVFLALEQMISKGKVTTEELRRQLGERIPGAFNIMAAAIGVNVRKLDEMLKKGEVLSEEALPKMAAEMLKTFGIEQVTRVDTLIAAQERLRTTWLSFIKDLEASDTFREKLEGLNQAFIHILNVFGFLNDSAPKGLAKANMVISSIADNSPNAAAELNKLKEKYEELDAATLAAGDAVDAMFIDIQKNFDKGLSKDELLERLTPDQKTLWGSYQSLLAQRQAFKDQMNRIWQRMFIEDLEIQKWSTDELEKKEKFYLEFEEGKFTKIDGFKEEALKKDKYLRKEAIATLEKTLTEDQIKPWLRYYAIIDELRRRNASLDLEEEDKTWNERLAIFKAQQAAAFNRYREHKEAMRLAAEKIAVDSGLNEIQLEDVTNGLKMDMETDFFEFRKAQAGELLKFVKGHKKDEADAVKASTDLAADYTKKLTDFEISEMERYHQIYNKEEEDKKKKIQDDIDEQIAAIEARLQGELEAEQASATSKTKIAKANYELDKISQDLSKKSVEYVIKAYEDMLKIEGLSTNERANIAEKLHNAKMSQMEIEAKKFEYDNKRQIELEERKKELFMQYGQAVFDFFSERQNARLEQLQWDFERETNLAGENLDKKLALENEYSKEKRKLQRRQAILDKANAIFNIIISTAQAIAAALEFPVLIPFIKILGGLQLATVVATPLPKYEKGGKHEGGPAIFSEGGKPELFIPVSGDPILTPPKETTAIMPAGTFIPHDETQRILANDAINNFVNEIVEIDFTPTNNILKKIANKSETIYSNGYKITNKNHIFGRYVTRQ